jgi:hypothetical protein
LRTGKLCRWELPLPQDVAIGYCPGLVSPGFPFPPIRGGGALHKNYLPWTPWKILHELIEGCVDLDIRPGSCPNNFVRGVMGVFNMSLTGMPGFNAELIDTSSLLLARADGVGGTLAQSDVVLGDLATPYPGALCNCHTLAADGWDDLNLSFKNAAVNSTFLLNNVPTGQSVVLEIIGTFRDGTPFSASDCIVLQSAMSAVAGHAR